MRKRVLSPLASVLVAAAIGLPSALSVQAASLEDLRAQKDPEEKLDKLKQQIKELKDELKLVRNNLLQNDTYFASEVDSSAKDGDYLFVGTGIPATNFVIQRGDYEVAMKFHLRQGGDIPVSFIDTQSVIHVFVPSGPQPSVSNRAAWNVTFSVNTAYGSADTLENIDAKLRLDLDPGEGTDFLNLKLGPFNTDPAGQQNGYAWANGEVLVINDDEGTAQVTQNSFNYEFIRPLILGGYDNYPPATFDIQLTVKNRADIKVRVHVVPPV